MGFVDFVSCNIQTKSRTVRIRARLHVIRPGCLYRLHPDLFTSNPKILVGSDLYITIWFVFCPISGHQKFPIQKSNLFLPPIPNRRPPPHPPGAEFFLLRLRDSSVSAAILSFSIFGPLSSLRSCICLKEGRSGIIHKAKNNCQLTRGVFSSYGSQETKLSSEEKSKDKFLIDCGTDQECIVGGIVALGKFDALHIGHRELAIQASKIGIPFLLSFVGMAEVLGWPARPPIVAKCDRERVLSSWAPYCANMVPLEFQVEFSNVRHLTPQQFVEKLSKELRVSGVVAGENYRFGYRASGDAHELVRLCKEYGLDVCIVNNVMDTTQQSNGVSGKIINSGEKGQVSSTRVRQALVVGDMEHVAQLLGRKHRLVLLVSKECWCPSSRRALVPRSCLLNLPPGDGRFDSCTLLVDNVFVGPCKVAITPENLDIELDGGSLQNLIQDGCCISIEFG